MKSLLAQEADAAPVVSSTPSRWRRFLSLVGPGFMVSVGYMDPGNWATGIAGGARYGYQLLWVILASNLVAIFLQTLCLRLGLVSGKDLAQSCRERYSKPVSVALWLLCELAIIACDIAEVVGSAIALNLLFDIPLVAGVLITGLDVFLLLMLADLGFRRLEAVVFVLVATIATCFGLEIIMSQPDWGGVARGLVIPSIPDREALYISLGIIGATVMPHNLYLHSSIVKNRRASSLDDTIRLYTVDTVLALMWAFFVNAAILVMAAAVFYGSGYAPQELEEAYRLLTPLLGGTAATVFAVALLASGQSSTITGTLAGQIVMEGFLHLRMRPWLRRLITRSLAVIPAIIMILHSHGRGTVDILVVSQVILSMQLPFAIFPLVFLTSDKSIMGKYANSRPVELLAYILCIVIAGLNLAYLVQILGFFVVLGLILGGFLFVFLVHLHYRKT